MSPTGEASSGQDPAVVLPAALGRVLAEYAAHLERERQLSVHTIRAYAGDLTQLLVHLHTRGHEDLTTIDRRDLRSWLAHQSTLGAERSTLQRRAAAARVGVPDRAPRDGPRGGPTVAETAAAVAGAAVFVGERGARIDPWVVRRIVHWALTAVPGAPTSVPTACGMRWPPTSSRVARTCAAFRRCWATPRWRRPRSTHVTTDRLRAAFEQAHPRA